MEIDTLEYSRVKATSVFVRLRIFLCALKNTNKLSGVVAGDRFKTLFLVMTLRNINKLSSAIAGKMVDELTISLA